MLKEIVTKAVISKGKITDNEEMEFVIAENVNKVIGCWIINHNYLSVIEDDKVYVKGFYDVHVWYAMDNSSDTEIFKSTIEYKHQFNLDNENFNKNDSEYKLYCIEYPTCNKLELYNNRIIVNVKKCLAIDVIGESKLLVQVSEACNQDDSDMRINTNFINR